MSQSNTQLNLTNQPYLRTSLDVALATAIFTPSRIKIDLISASARPRKCLRHAVRLGPFDWTRWHTAVHNHLSTLCVG